MGCTALSVTLAPARVDPRLTVRARQRWPPEDMVRGLFADHDRRRVQIAVGDAWKDRAVGEAQSIDADHPALRVDNRHRVRWRAHRAAATGVKGAFHMFFDESVQLVIALHAVARLDLLAAVGIESGLREDLARYPDAMAEIGPVLGPAHVIEQDLRRIVRIARA